MQILVVPLPKCIAGMALWPFILVRDENPSSRLIQHEKIHLRQQVELGIVFFYCWYVTEFLFRFFWTFSYQKAYKSICFEREAYTHEAEVDYLVYRKTWHFLSYL